MSSEFLFTRKTSSPPHQKPKTVPIHIEKTLKAICMCLHHTLKPNNKIKSWQHPKVFPGGPPPQY